MCAINQISFGWRRGKYQQLILDLPDNIEEHQKHAADLAKKQWEDVRVIVWEAQRRGLLPVDYKDWDHKGRGESISLDLYGFSPTIGPKLVLVQVRRTYRYATKHFLTVVKNYIITDGEKAIKVPGQVVKMAIKIDPDVDSPLRALKSRLPDEWKLLVAQQLKLPAPSITHVTIVYKAVEIDDGGVLRSLFNPEYIYKIGKLHKEKAKPNHNGGLYAYPTWVEAREFGLDWAKKFNIRKIAILKCLGYGRPIVYEQNKLCFSMLKPMEIVEIIDFS